MEVEVILEGQVTSHAIIEEVKDKDDIAVQQASYN